MPKTKVEVYDKDQLIYPYIESDHVTFSNGMKVSEMLDQSISMPTITHNETSFKVGVGDSDVSSSIVDSSVSKMVIKGQTYQNILPEPSTHVLTNNKEIFKVNEGLDPNVEIVDGVSKSAILSGQTLVNLLKVNKDNYIINNSQNWSIEDGYLKCVSTTSWHTVTDRFNNMIKPSTKYLIVVEIKENTLNIDINFDGFGTTLGTASTFLKFESNEVGTKKVIVTTPSTIDSTKNGLFRMPINVPNKGSILKFRVMAIEYQQGMENWDIPYFEGMQSVKMPVLSTCGKNLFDPNNVVIDSSNTYGYIDLSKHETLTFSITDKDTSIDMSSIFFGATYQGYDYDGTNQNGGGWLFANGEFARSSLTTTQCKYFSFHPRNKATFDKIVARYNIQIEEGSTVTPYEPYKSNILSTPSDLELRGIGEGSNRIEDKLNCLTGELTQRVGEMVLDGVDMAMTQDTSNGDYVRFNLTRYNGKSISDHDMKVRANLKCDKLPVLTDVANSQDCIHNGGSDTYKLMIWLHKSKLNSLDNAGICQYLQSNPITVQYEISTESIKTVDLSSSGNWEKVVLDGRQGFSWQEDSIKAFYIKENRLEKLQDYSRAIISDTGSVVNNYGSFVDGCNEVQITGYPDTQNKYPNENWLYIRVPDIKSDVNALKQYLSQNPITVWFQTATHQDSTQVKQPIFFKDGHIIQSSGADNSLIPTLDYQAKTSNSYVMDLMKANTIYTMKNDSANGKFTIDGTQYNLVTNGKLKTPTTLTDKLLIINGSASNTMILEGDLTSKTIPYFKGIKSAFEDKSKIEVLSTGKNLFDGELRNGYYSNGEFKYNENNKANVSPVRIKPNTTYVLTSDGDPKTTYYDKDMNFISYHTTRVTTSPQNASYMNFHGHSSTYFQLEESSTSSSYEPYKSNTTKIPLLSPLRSLPNGICDEIVLDRENNKAKIVQRVGVGVLDGTQYINMVDSSVDTSLYQPFFYGDVFGNMAVVSRDVVVVRCDKLLANSQIPTYRELTFNAIYQYTDSSARLAGQITKKDLGVKSVNDWFRANPTTIYYQLATPVITEVDLEGFPYIYKEGHIFLNSEIVPATEIIYSIDQCQQISASNEDIIRHEKELTYLQKLIAQYVQVDYESVLLSLKV